MASKNSFVLYMDYKEKFSKLSNSQFGELMRMVFDYEAGIEPVTNDVMVDVAFDVIRYDLDKNRAKYEEIIEKRRVAGKSKSKQKLSNDSKCKQVLANDSMTTPVSDSESVSVSDSVSVNDNDSVTQIGSVKKEKSTKEKRKRFTPPTVEAVRDYSFEKGLSIDAEKFVDFYTANGWKVGKNPMKDWRAAVRNWSRRTDKPRSGTMSTQEYLAYWGLEGSEIFDTRGG